MLCLKELLRSTSCSGDDAYSYSLTPFYPLKRLYEEALSLPEREEDPSSQLHPERHQSCKQSYPELSNQHSGKWHGDPTLMLWGAEESQAEPCSNSWPTKPWHVSNCTCLKMLNLGTAMENQDGSFFISLSPIQFTWNEYTTGKPSFK